MQLRGRSLAVRKQRSAGPGRGKNRLFTIARLAGVGHPRRFPIVRPPDV